MTWQYSNKTIDEVIYLVAENGDNYLVGFNEDEVLTTQDALNWKLSNKNTNSWSYQDKS